MMKQYAIRAEGKHFFEMFKQTAESDPFDTACAPNITMVVNRMYSTKINFASTSFRTWRNS